MSTKVKSPPYRDRPPVAWVQLTAEEKHVIRVAAAVTGKSMSQFLRDCALAAAQKIRDRP